MKRILYLHFVLLVGVCVYGETNAMPREKQVELQTRNVTVVAAPVPASANMSIQNVFDGGMIQKQFGQIPAAALALPWALLMVLACCWPKSGTVESPAESLRNQCIPVGWE